MGTKTNVDLFQPVKTTRLPDAVAEQIRELILQGRVKPGDRLPSDGELAEQFGASRASVRQALRQLQQQGMVEIRQGMRGGVFVAPGDGRAMVRSLKLLLRLRRVPVEQISEVRLLIEPVVAGRAARLASEGWMERMTEVVQGMKQNLASQESFERFDEEFHQLLAQVQENPILEFLTTTLVEVMRDAFSGIDVGVQNRRRLARSHERVFKAIRSREEAAAEEATITLIKGATRWMAPLMKKSEAAQAKTDQRGG